MKRPNIARDPLPEIAQRIHAALPKRLDRAVNRTLVAVLPDGRVAFGRRTKGTIAKVLSGADPERYLVGCYSRDATAQEIESDLQAATPTRTGEGL